MAERPTYLIDDDYLSGPSAIALNKIRRAVRGLVPDATLLWDADDPHLSRLAMTESSFHKLQHKWLAAGVPVDLFYPVDDQLTLEIRGDRKRDRLARASGFTYHPSPRRFAREHFADSRIVREALRREPSRFTVDEDEAHGRLADFEDNVLSGFSVGRQLRFIRVGLELAETEGELAYIAAGPLENAIVASRSNRDMDQIAHESAISPLLRTSCRDLVWTEGAGWSDGIRKRWDDIVHKS